MESGDGAPPCDPKRKDLMQKEQLKVISMLVAMETEDSLRRGAIIIIITKKLAWQCRAKSACELGVLILQNIFHAKKLQKKGYVLPSIF